MASAKSRGFGAGLCSCSPSLPFSSTCDFPALVEATTPAVAWLTPREACWSLQRLALSLSAFTYRGSGEGCAYSPPGEQKTSPTIWGDRAVPEGHPKPRPGEQPRRCLLGDGASPRAECRQRRGSLPGRRAPTLEAATS